MDVSRTDYELKDAFLQSRFDIRLSVMLMFIWHK